MRLELQWCSTFTTWKPQTIDVKSIGFKQKSLTKTLKLEIMKKSLVIFSLFSLMMVLTSFTTPNEIGGRSQIPSFEIGGRSQIPSFEIGGRSQVPTL